MSSAGFVGRQQELDALRREFDRTRPSLAVVLGRRRVGKSTMLLEAIRGRGAVYFQATKATLSVNLEFAKAAVAEALGADPLLSVLPSWEGLLTWFEQAAKARPGLVLVLDEFPYLCDVEPALPSIVQAFWDRVRAAGTNLKLVLCGSKISFMEGVLAERNPLHGRQTLRLDVSPLPYRDAAAFFPGWSAEDCLRAYATLGGMPYYLALCDPAEPLAANVHGLVLARGAPLAEEPDTLLQAELRDVSRYTSLLQAVAGGCTTSGEVIGRVREFGSASELAAYVTKLSELRLLRVVRSLDAPGKDRDRRYYLDDPFLAFWYRFVLPNQSALATGHGREVWDRRIAPRLDEYMGDLFEWICRDHARLYAQETLPAPAQAIGQIWAADYDIDVAGTLLDGNALFGECKWWKDPVGGNVLDGLVGRAARTSYGRDAPDRFHLLYSRAGFTDGLLRRADQDPSVRLLDPRRLLGW